MNRSRYFFRSVALILTLAMMLSSMSIAVFAEDGDPAGTDGQGVEVTDVTDNTGSEDVTGGEELGEEQGTEEPAADPEEPQDPEEPAVTIVAPANVASTVDNKNVTISWDQTEGQLYTVVISKDGEDVVTETGISAGSYTSARLHAGSYTYSVGTYFEAAPEEVAWSEQGSFEITSLITVPPVITKFTVPPQGITPAKDGKSTEMLNTGNLCTIKWSKAEGAVASYSIVRISEDMSEKIMKKGIKATETSCQFRADAGTYSYAVRAVSTDASDYEDSEAESAGEVRKYLTADQIDDFCWYVYTKKATTLYKNKKGSAKAGTIASGVKGRFITNYPKYINGWAKPRRIKVKFENGKTGWVAFSSVKFKVNDEINYDYPIDVKMDYVKKLAAKKKLKTKYFIWVNAYTQRANIFKKVSGKWKLIRNCRVTLGNPYQPVSKGWKRIGAKKARCNRIDDKGRRYFFRKATSFHGTGYFHTRSYWSDTGKPKNNIRKTPNTRGCVRMYTSDAAFIYKHIPRGTVVLFK